MAPSSAPSAYSGFIPALSSCLLLVALTLLSQQGEAAAVAETDNHQVAAAVNLIPAGTPKPVSPEVPTTTAQATVDGRQWVATVSDEFVCATLDWWPSTKCNYGTCPWYSTSILNLDLDNPVLIAAVKALAPLKLRLGGTLQDAIFYNVDSSMEPCIEPVGNSSSNLGFNVGCLSVQRWDEINQFFIKTGASVAFGLNVLHGRTATENWNASNAADLIRLSHRRGYPITAWELGNELLGESYGPGLQIPPNLYAENMRKLREIVNEVYTNDSTKPLVIAPDSYYWVGNTLYPALLNESGPTVLDVVTRHIYNLGPGVTTTEELVNRIRDPTYSRNEAITYAELQNVLKDYSWAEAWVGESGGAYNSGHENVTDSFIMAFWYLDQMGLAAKYNNQVFCRQSLIGGYYGLLDGTTYAPNPDFYGAVLWKTLMGSRVLSVTVNSTDIRAYAHCQKSSTQGGVTVLILNYSNETTYSVDIPLLGHSDATFAKRELTPDVDILPVQEIDNLSRLEYFMAPDGGDIHSRVALLNGLPLRLTSSRKLPSLKPRLADGSSLISLSPLTYAFVVFPQASLGGCVAF